MLPVKLTWEKVDQIRSLYAPGKVGYNSLAKRFGVSQTSIKSIIRGETWPPEKDFRKRPTRWHGFNGEILR
jgi:uncharacterized protein YjcR